ncbi:MAG: peptidylprolyl isomerase [Oscillospiraceae bacterium]|nr:peptidylprolyl isomerase [Oscillospiraceae bacterium]
MEDGGIIKIELYPGVAPNTVNNFISLANKGFYDGTIFHRVSPTFMIQGGDPEGDGTGGPGYSIKGEFTNNDFKNDLSHKRGVISMGRRSGMNDSAGCQFFICVVDASRSLDGDYASFGKVIEGMDAVDKIAAAPGTKLDSSTVKPKEEQKMKKVTVDTFGTSYPEPETIKR